MSGEHVLLCEVEEEARPKCKEEYGFTCACILHGCVCDCKSSFQPTDTLKEDLAHLHQSKPPNAKTFLNAPPSFSWFVLANCVLKTL